MTQTFNTNGNNDIFIAGNGLLSIASGLDAVLKACETATYAQLGEMVLATKNGIPNSQAIWVGVPNYQIFELYLRNAILSVDGVKSIRSLQIRVQGDILNYTATIITIYGSGSIAGNIAQGV